MNMRDVIDATEIKKMLEEHEAWLNNAGGKRLDLSNKIIHVLDMRGINLTGANLRGAVLMGANLKGAVLAKADLSGADLTSANLREADLKEADLKEADLRGAFLARTDLRRACLYNADLALANLYGAQLICAKLVGARLVDANLRRANLQGASLGGANLQGADLRESNLRQASLINADLRDAVLSGALLIVADLTGANFIGADFTGAELRDTKLVNTCGLPALVCPEKGSFVGWKYAVARIMMSESNVSYAYSPVLIELEIPASAKRTSSTGRKCRCSKAKVKQIVSIYTGEKLEEAVSKWNWRFKYVVGETVEVKDFDENRWNECAPGIHFFMTQSEVFRYAFGKPGGRGDVLYAKFKRDGKISD